MLRISRSALKGIVVFLLVTLACGVYVLFPSTSVQVHGSSSLTALPRQPSTRDTIESTVPVLPTLSRHLTDPKVNLDRHFQELSSRYTPDKPTAVVVTIPSISSADIQPCKNDTICQEYLLPDVDLTYWKQCVEKVENVNIDTPIPKCRFMDGTNRYPVALASLPGSGNTWVRGLLEQATGICTGSVYCDVTLRAMGMMGENIRSGTVLVVKTHHRDDYEWSTGNVSKLSVEDGSVKHHAAQPMYSSGILIVRNPLDALVSEWNRRKAKQTFRDGTQHVSVVGPEFFGDGKGWNKWVVKGIAGWQDHFTMILSGNGHPVLVVRYEDIKADTVREVKRMLEFLKFPYKESELVERLAIGFNDFHRASHPTFEHYTAEQKEYVRAKVKETVKLLKKWKHPSVAEIEKYL